MSTPASDSLNSLLSLSSATNIHAMSTSTASPAKPTSPKNAGSAQKKKSTSLPAETVDYLKAWMMSPEHIAHPYPTEQEKSQIMADTGIELKQLTNWFVNNRKRYWKPRVEARLQQQGETGQVSASSTPIKRKSSSQSLVGDVTEDPPLASSQDQLMTSSNALIRRVSLQALVSDASSSASSSSGSSSSASSCSSDADSGSVSAYSSNEDDMASMTGSANGFETTSGGDEVITNEGSVARTESVDVHILRPVTNGARPSIADVSILSTVPTERILCTYERCPLKYSLPMDSIQDRKKVQSRRDAEIVRLKRKFLKLYLEECGLSLTTVAAPTTVTTNKRSSSSQEQENTPRKRFCLESPGLWKEACESADGLYDIDLPTLEEATLLFGFSRGISA